MSEGNDGPEPARAQGLLRDARAGNADALGRLLEGCRNYLLMVANRELSPVVQGKLGPSDLVQETLGKALEDFGRFQGGSEDELLAWLRCILRNRLRNAVRHHLARQANREVSLSDKSVDGPAHRLSARTGPPDEQALARERLALLELALAALPEHYRQIIHWRQNERLSFAEIGQRLDRSENAARKLWTRALDELGRLLEDGDEQHRRGTAGRPARPVAGGLRRGPGRRRDAPRPAHAGRPGVGRRSAARPGLPPAAARGRRPVGGPFRGAQLRPGPWHRAGGAF
jgi:RNA polymerase sigma-70 factor (ECF subfamily)